MPGTPCERQYIFILSPNISHIKLGFAGILEG